MGSLVNLVLITGWLIPLYTATQPEPETVDLQVWFDFFTSDVTVRKFQVKVLAQVLDVPKIEAMHASFPSLLENLPYFSWDIIIINNNLDLEIMFNIFSSYS